MAAAYREMTAIYRDRMRLSQEEAFERVTGTDADRMRDHLLHDEPEQIMWPGIQRLTDVDPIAAQQVWERLKRTASDELTSGHRAAAVLDYDGLPWDRARFLAIRQAFSEEWQPQGGIELALLDTLAQSHSQYLWWLERLHLMSILECQLDDPKLRRQGYWQPPRVDGAQAIAEAGAMVERFNRLFLRTLRALRDLRRYTPPSVVVQQAGQVNVGQQQVNVTGSDPR
ncbi:MAG TPA: hypothetical protein VGW38_05770 [Chloroflexota bacterium]|nr:hypothetical protein [Chloroflexota bacterium]